MKKGKLFFGLLMFVPLLSGCKGTENIGEEIKAKLIPSWAAFVVQFAALMVLLIVVFFVAYKPVKRILQKRADYVEKNIRDSEENKAIAERNAIQSEETILASKKEAALIIETANEQAKREYAENVEQTKLEIQKMKMEAQEDIERSRQEALDQIHDEMVDVALSASSEILKREVNTKDNARLAEEFIDNLN